MVNNNILKNDVRIFRPCEVTALVKAIPKVEYKTMFEAMLYTGCRFEELKWLMKHPANFDSEAKSIKMLSKKAKVRHKERYIRLNNNGKRAVEYFLREKKNLPSRDGWNADLKRWCRIAGVDDGGVCSKSTRKTWESWLATMYSDKYPQIFLSQGHSDKVSIEYYLMLPFNDKDKDEMKYYTDGWI
jgi:integrase